MPRFMPIAAAALIAAAAATPAVAADLQIFQKGKEFSEKSVTIKAGQSIEFVNDDGNVHNVHSATEGHVFDLGAQDPGTSNTHVFATPGEVAVRCAIHPRMRLTVMVE